MDILLPHKFQLKRRILCGYFQRSQWVWDQGPINLAGLQTHNEISSVESVPEKKLKLWINSLNKIWVSEVVHVHFGQYLVNLPKFVLDIVHCFFFTSTIITSQCWEIIFKHNPTDIQKKILCLIYFQHSRNGIFMACWKPQKLTIRM